MHDRTKILVTAVALAASLTIAPALYAQDKSDGQGSMMGNGMTNGSGMMGGNGTMNGNGMAGVKDMMAQMSRMMESCNSMMQAMMKDSGTGQPDAAPKQTPDKPGNKG